MNKLFFVIIFAIILSGCSTFPQVDTQKVEMPVFQEVPSPPKLNDPELPIHTLNENSTEKEIAEAYVITVKILQKELEYRTFLLKSYDQKE